MRDFFVMAHMDVAGRPDTVCGFIRCETNLHALQHLQRLVEEEWRRKWPDQYSDENPVFTDGWGMLDCNWKATHPVRIGDTRVWVYMSNSDDILKEVVVEIGYLGE